MISGARNSILKWHHIDVKGTIISPRRHLLPIHTHQAGGKKSPLKTKKPSWLAHSRQIQTPACFFSAVRIASWTSSATQINKTHPSRHPHDGIISYLFSKVNRCPGGTGEQRRGSTHSIAFIPIAAITNGMSMTKANLPTGLQSMKHLTIWPQGLAAI